MLRIASDFRARLAFFILQCRVYGNLRKCVSVILVHAYISIALISAYRKDSKLALLTVNTVCQYTNVVLTHTIITLIIIFNYTHIMFELTN